MMDPMMEPLSFPSFSMANRHLGFIPNQMLKTENDGVEPINPFRRVYYEKEVLKKTSDFE